MEHQRARHDSITQFSQEKDDEKKDKTYGMPKLARSKIYIKLKKMRPILFL